MVNSMGRLTGQKREEFTRRHPVVAFLGLLLTLSVLVEALAAGIQGGWSLWGTSILWYRLSSLMNSFVVGAGAYGFVRWFYGANWWRETGGGRWSLFVGIALLQSMFLLILTQRFARMYGEAAPPMATDWLPALVRVLVPLLCLYWVRLYVSFSVAPRPSAPSHNYP